MSLFRYFIVLWISFSVLPIPALADDYSWHRDIAYYGEHGPDDYASDSCRLDVYYPTHATDFATIVWLHAGGLKAGERYVPGELMGQGFAVIAVDYRLSLRAKCPAYIEDAAAAIAWTFKHIEEFGGSNKRIFVAGASAGGYLAAVTVLDRRWLKAHEVDANQVAAVVSQGGHMITHFTIREERGISPKMPVVDEFAPLSHIRRSAPPMLLFTGDRELELYGRYEENAYFWRMMKGLGHSDIELIELVGLKHEEVEAAAYPYTVEFIKRINHTL